MSENRRPPDGPNSPDNPSARAESKRKVLTEALERGLTLVRLDARRAGVHVPDKLSNEFGLALNFSWRFAHTDMVINERGIAATLRFGGVPSRCIVPWSAVWGIVPPGHSGTKVWPLDLPVELDGPERDGPEIEPEPVEPVRPRLQVIREVKPAAEPKVLEAVPPPPADESAAPPPAPSGDEKPRAPWLRLVR